MALGTNLTKIVPVCQQGVQFGILYFSDTDIAVTVKLFLFFCSFAFLYLQFSTLTAGFNTYKGRLFIYHSTGQTWNRLVEVKQKLIWSTTVSVLYCGILLWNIIIAGCNKFSRTLLPNVFYAGFRDFSLLSECSFYTVPVLSCVQKFVYFYSLWMPSW